MGVLDEAIRQHLELKRRRGADAGEIKREEDEALGEVARARRPGTDQAVADSAEEAQPPQIAASEIAENEDSGSTAHQPTEAFDPAELAAALGQTPEDVPAEVPQLSESELTEPETGVEPEMDVEPETEQQPVAEPQHQAEAEPDPPEPDEGASLATEEPAAEDTEPEADETPDEPAAPGDELEETPEFLEDAPEHDKLWFEQKPPKDFDF